MSIREFPPAFSTLFATSFRESVVSPASSIEPHETCDLRLQQNESNKGTWACFMGFEPRCFYSFLYVFICFYMFSYVSIYVLYASIWFLFSDVSICFDDFLLSYIFQFLVYP